MWRKRNDAWLERIQRELTCPDCSYSLQGLAGSVVVCPECGAALDLAAMVTKRWTGRWYRAPGFNRLLVPVAWLTIGFMIVAVLSGLAGHQLGFVLGMMVVGVGWLVLLLRLWRTPMGARAVRLSLLAHVIFIAYLWSVVMILAVVGLLIPLLFQAGVPVLFRSTIPALLFLTAVGGVWLARYGERYIAKQCIRFHFRSAVAADSARSSNSNQS